MEGLESVDGFSIDVADGAATYCSGPAQPHLFSSNISSTHRRCLPPAPIQGQEKGDAMMGPVWIGGNPSAAEQVQEGLEVQRAQEHCDGHGPAAGRATAELAGKARAGPGGAPGRACPLTDTVHPDAANGAPAEERGATGLLLGQVEGLPVCPGLKRPREEESAAAATGTTNLDVLPDELLLLVLRYASKGSNSPISFVNLLLVSRRMRQLGSSAPVLRHLPLAALRVSAGAWTPSALLFLHKCTQADNAAASYALGMIVFYCLGRVQWGRRLLGQAAAAGCHEALYSLAVIHFNGSGGARRDKDSAAAVALCLLAADVGNTDAMRELGHCFQDGHGVPRDAARGQKLLLKASMEESAKAFRLATLRRVLRRVPTQQEAAMCTEAYKPRGDASDSHRQSPGARFTRHFSWSADDEGGWFWQVQPEDTNSIFEGEGSQDASGLANMQLSPCTRAEQEQSPGANQEHYGRGHGRGQGGATGAVGPLSGAPEAVAGSGSGLEAEHATPGLPSGALRWSQSSHWRAHCCCCLPSVVFALPARSDGWVQAFLRDWHTHRAPEMEVFEAERERCLPCSNIMCGRVETRADEFRCCAVCAGARYCSRVCQAQDWMNGHNQACSPLQ